jgi:hypothetical protein
MNGDKLLWRRVFLALETLIMENKELKGDLDRPERALAEYRDMDRSMRGHCSDHRRRLQKKCKKRGRTDP